MFISLDTIMKTVLMISCLLAVAWSAPPRSHHPLRELPALRHEEVHDEYGQYAFRYITAEDTVVSERGRLVPSSNGRYVLEIEGRYQFIGDDGQVYARAYRGGVDGFHVDGNYLPKQVPLMV